MPLSTKPSRRSLLAGIPAIAAAVSPGAATALGGLPAQPADDPIFAVIDRYQKAVEACDEAADLDYRLRSEHEEKQDERGVYLCDTPEIDVRCTAERHAGGVNMVIHETPTGRMKPVFAKLPADIDRNVPKAITDPAEVEAWKAEKHRELEQWSGTFDGSPISNASDAWNDANDCLIRATAELNTPPTTLAGMAALLRIVADHYHDNESGPWHGIIYDWDKLDAHGTPTEIIFDNAGLLLEILKTLATAAQSIHA